VRLPFRPEDRSGPTLHRAPVDYTPRSTTSLNFERLNTAHPWYSALRLQFRPPELDADQDFSFGIALVRAMLLLGFVMCAPPLFQKAFGTAFMLIVVGMFPTTVALYAAYTVHPRRRQLFQFAVVAWLVVLYSFAIVALDDRHLIEGSPYVRVFVSVLVALVSCLVLKARVRYLRADPSFAPPQDEPAFLRDPVPMVPILLITAPLMWFVPRVMYPLGMIGLFLIGRRGTRILRAFLTIDNSNAPGMWRPSSLPAAARVWLFVAALALANLFANTHTYWQQRYLSDHTYYPSVFGHFMANLGDDIRGVGPQSSRFILTLYGSLYGGILGSASSLIFFGLYMGPFWFYERYIERNRKTQSKADERQVYADRLRHSPVVVTDPDGEEIQEADHLYLGNEPFQEFPVLLHRPLLGEHAHILGDSGSGKTSLGLIPLLSSLIEDNVHAFNRPKDQAAIVILDLKGDMALFETARTYEQHFPSRFRYFSPERGRSYAFNPFSDLRSATRQTPIQIAQLLLDALALNHGEGYGRSYYSKRSRDLLLHAIEQSNAANFEELYAFLDDAITADPNRYREAFELVATVRALTYYPQLLTTPTRRDPSKSGKDTAAGPTRRTMIHMPAVLAKRQVVYFWLPSAAESVSVREIGKLALYSLVSAALARRARGFPVRRTYLFIDEFQQIAGENFKVILQQARSLGIGVILANQSNEDLRTPAADLRSTVRTNTRVKMYFSIQDPQDLMALSEASGLDAVTMQTTSRSLMPSFMGGETTSSSYAEKPRLTETDLRAISDHPRRLVFHVSRGSGFTQFGGLAIPLETSFTLSRYEYEQRASARWPDDPKIPHFGPPPPKTIDSQAVHEVERQRDLIAKLSRQRSIAEGLPEVEA